jgi:hypothetical protein
MGMACNMHEGEEECTQDFEGKDRKRPLGVVYHMWKDNIKVDLREIW